MIKSRSAISSTVIVVVIVVVILIAAAGVYVSISKPTSTVTVTSGTTATLTSGTTATITSGTTATVTKSSTSTSQVVTSLSPSQSITVSTISTNYTYLVMYVAANGGFCSQLGLDVTYTPSPSSTALSEEMATNEVQFATFSPTSALTALNSSVPITGVAVDYGTTFYSLAISNSSSINSVAQLKGSGYTFADSGPGASDLALRALAQENGLTVGTGGSPPNADIQVDALSSATAADTALVAGKVQGSIDAFPGLFPYVVAGDVKILANYTFPQNVLMATNSEIAHSPSAIETLLQCYFNAAAYVSKNETYANQMALKYIPTYTTQEVQELYTAYYTDRNASLTSNGAFTSTVLQQYTNLRALDLSAYGYGANALPTVSQLITTQFVPINVQQVSP